MKLEIDPDSCTPLASQVAEGIRDWIVKHGAGGGSRLPSIRRLSSDLGVSRNTTIEAYERLVAQGLVRSRPGSGFYVADNASNTLGKRLVETAGIEELTSDMWALFQADDEELKLGCGWLPNHWREGDDLAYAIRQVTRQNRAGLFEYSSPMGTPELRALLRERLRLLGIDVAAEQILLTAGASHALDLIVRHMLEPGDTVFVESPGYYNLFGLLRLHRINIIGVPRMAEGPDAEQIEQLLKTHRPKLFFTNSVFQNPTGTTLVPTVAHRILQLAEAHDFRIVEDDIYADFQHDPSIRLATLDGLRRVIYLGSFSKSLSSSLRVGFIAAEPGLMKPLVDIKMLTSIAASRFAEQVVTLMLQNGSYRKLVERLRTRLSGQMAAALNLVKGAGWEVFVEPAGGMFLWVRHPDIESSSQLVAHAKHAGISLSPGHLFLPQEDDSPWLRINVAYLQDKRAVHFINAPVNT
ncbi:PLP-dependent aminotransferase family protein [Halomonas sp. McH1-25]|uniref:aminotransferase-like domain-containing protein n=1 Tax=unclassified Halomonas TaxID=2609666 RepID=UPI001EF7170B|nr:PLP-dependent aminotransferase family protein [Halomonas sp. McH1-25]MCP1343108.1 PLP-dependent aminotransferase family protein [Halomonas sp. FL8]MCP1360483.1 PLP-dependent aminotransferase family protein [Halomonas sp. BBD45]